MSATQTWSGRCAVKRHSSRSGAALPASAWMVVRRRPRRRETPSIPSSALNPGRPFLGHADTLVAKLGVREGDAVRTPAVLKRRQDHRFELPVLAATPTLRAIPPLIETLRLTPTRRHSRETRCCALSAATNRNLTSVPRSPWRRKPPPYAGSRSSRNTRFSRRNRRNSSRSSLKTLRPPLIHIRLQHPPSATSPTRSPLPRDRVIRSPARPKQPHRLRPKLRRKHPPLRHHNAPLQTPTAPNPRLSTLPGQARLDHETSTWHFGHPGIDLGRRHGRVVTGHLGRRAAIGPPAASAKVIFHLVGTGRVEVVHTGRLAYRRDFRGGEPGRAWPFLPRSRRLVERPNNSTSVEGTTTLVFTDIEESTALNALYGDRAWFDVLRAHNQVVASATEPARRHGGEKPATASARLRSRPASPEVRASYPSRHVGDVP